MVLKRVRCLPITVKYVSKSNSLVPRVRDRVRVRVTLTLPPQNSVTSRSVSGAAKDSR